MRGDMIVESREKGAGRGARGEWRVERVDRRGGRGKG